MRSPWPEYDIDNELTDLSAVSNLLPDLDSGHHESRRDFELFVNLENSYDDGLIAVRADGLTIGYMSGHSAREWRRPVQKVIEAGLVPVTNGRLWASQRHVWENDDWDAATSLKTFVRLTLALGDPETALPENDPPSEPYTLIPRSSIVQVTKEDEYAGSLLRFVPATGYGMFFATLHAVDRSTAKTSKTIVGVRIDGEQVGELTPQMSRRFLPMIEHLHTRGLLTACWADITGSSVAAKVRIDALKANEVSSDLLDGPPLVLPSLHADSRGVRSRADIHSSAPRRSSRERTGERSSPEAGYQAGRVPDEPSLGSVVRWPVDDGSTNLAIRAKDTWLTTSTCQGVQRTRSTANWSWIAQHTDLEIGLDWKRPPQSFTDRAVLWFRTDDGPRAALYLAKEGAWFVTGDSAQKQPDLGSRVQGNSFVPTRWEPVA